VRVRDADIDPRDTHTTVNLFMRQSGEGATAAPRKVLQAFERRRDGTFAVAVPLTTFAQGPICVSVIASDASGRPLLMRSSLIQIVAAASQ
jgi:hypothetical protein